MCGAGTELVYTANLTAAVFCQPCGLGSFIDDSLKKCKSWTTCGPGEEQDPAITPSATADRKCRACADGFFSPNGDICQPWVKCTGNQFESAPPSALNDRQCRAATPCATDEYVVSQPAGTADRVCARSPKCVLGSTFSVAAVDKDIYGNALTAAVCMPCTVCPTNKNPGQSCTLTTDTVCVECGAECVPGAEYEISPCTKLAKRNCTACAACSPGLEYIEKRCVGALDTVCANITVGNREGVWVHRCVGARVRGSVGWAGVGKWYDEGEEEI